MGKRMTKNKLVSEIIKSYNSLILKLNSKKMISSYNDLAYSYHHKSFYIDYSSKSEISGLLFDDNISAIDLYSKLLRNNQFCIQFVDRSILLYSCLIHCNALEKQRIVYIKPFGDYEETERELGWEEYQTDEWSGRQLSFPLLIRIDYDSKAEKSDHPKCHLTLSNIKNCRIPVVSNISLERFVEFVLHQIFNIYNIKIEKSEYSKSIRDDEEKMIHVSWK